MFDNPLVWYNLYMSETAPTNENAKERVSSEQEILTIIEGFLNGASYEVLKKEEDADGLFLLQARTPVEDGFVDYFYKRTGTYEEKRAGLTAIHKSFLDTEAHPIGGQRVAVFLKNQWVFDEE